jgi:hypothetical protein
MLHDRHRACAKRIVYKCGMAKLPFLLAYVHTRMPADVAYGKYVPYGSPYRDVRNEVASRAVQVGTDACGVPLGQILLKIQCFRLYCIIYVQAAQPWHGWLRGNGRAGWFPALYAISRI